MARTCSIERRKDKSLGGLIPLTDASRRPVQFPVVTASIILANFIVWGLELRGGDAFVLKWSAVPADITSGHHWITILTAMFLHASWSHILGNMVFLWAFGPEIEDSMNPLRYLVFYTIGGLVAMLAQVLVVPNSTVPNLGASGAIASVMGAFLVTYPRDQIRSILIIFIFVRITLIPAALLIGVWFLIQLFHVGSIASVQTGGVAYLAHVAGAIFGAVTARLFQKSRRLAA
ncbi:MAG TPA: rhomboid family intramembrane serine protease [Candidatus Acidoferrales bacterium]|nr:rhomboid family intramembrane serine protease [Candidatus Acidoferrales bacterium]